MRRDVQRLAEQGLLSRFSWRRAPPSSTVENIAHNQRETLQLRGKARIARRRGPQVPHHCSLILNIGTTTEAIAQERCCSTGPARDHQQPERGGDPARATPDCEVIVAGGVVRARDRGIVGEATVDFIRQFKVDIA